MPKTAIGLNTLKMGAPAGDGGMGLTLTQLGYTVADTAVLATEEGTTTDFKVEEQDDPVYSIESERGRTTLSWSTYDVDPLTLQRLFGGTVVTGPPASWEAPASIPQIEQSIEIVMKSGGKIEVPRAKIVATLEWNLQKTRLAQINIVATILTPTKANTGPLKVTNAS